jgi:3alpha(or 20beta)-hydroxysteroid dehydrogenase
VLADLHHGDRRLAARVGGRSGAGVGVLADKVAIISGAARGQGLAEAERFVAKGARVVLIDRLAEAVEAAAGRLGDAARFVAGDVADERAWTEAVTLATDELGGVDILVNNAGVMVSRSLVDTDEATFRDVLDTNRRAHRAGGP